MATLNQYDDASACEMRWNRCEAELTESHSLVLHEGAWQALRLRDIGGRAINGYGALEALAFEPVCFLRDGRFEFARLLHDASGARQCVIMPAHDLSGAMIDLAAWHIKTGDWACWTGQAVALGLDSLPDDGPVPVHDTIEQWLAAMREGLFIVNPQEVRWLLAERKLVASNVPHGRALQRSMRLPEPQILIRRAVV